MTLTLPLCLPWSIGMMWSRDNLSKFTVNAACTKTTTSTISFEIGTKLKPSKEVWLWVTCCSLRSCRCAFDFLFSNCSSVYYMSTATNISAAGTVKRAAYTYFARILRNFLKERELFGLTVLMFSVQSCCCIIISFPQVRAWIQLKRVGLQPMVCLFLLGKSDEHFSSSSKNAADPAQIVSSTWTPIIPSRLLDIEQYRWHGSKLAWPINKNPMRRSKKGWVLRAFHKRVW